MKKIVIDTTLTPVNALEKGYKWWSDSLYIPDGSWPYEPGDADPNQDLWDLVEQGWKLGQPANRNFNDHAVGLYEPIK